ncbi:MAG: sigma 54-interacting transcriptional regulator [Flavobacteriales bacterium]|nr:sigma 54-interacting transcriptional regulator [Flavobacteriales bacterium]MCB9193673.1 sigma 54-interacting transcriptional regulator [Flavobacteriales bacterium]
MPSDPTTLGELKRSGYAPRSVRTELRENLIARMRAHQPLFEGIHGYEHTVIPALERAILSGHSINLLGLRGQAKTRMARSLVGLLDEKVPVVAGSEINDDPLVPISRYARDLIASRGDDTPISWLLREQRYTEKLATPDVTVADLIGDSDPIKAANLKLDYSDERVIHFGLVPRSHRGIFVINELPDLQPRIQVALFNILQEGDVQVRGFKLRLPLDIQFIFTANPEDYTNRGAIITPLKDRIQSQVLTHYPGSLDLGRRITEQEARSPAEQRGRIIVPDLMGELIERIAEEARSSEFVDQRSGVSARLTIGALESLRSAVERRALRSGEARAIARIADLQAVVPAIVGKIELVYEGEQEGPEKIAHHLIAMAVRNAFAAHYPDPGKLKRRKAINDSYAAIAAHFEGHSLDLLDEANEKEHAQALGSVPGLFDLVDRTDPGSSQEDRVLRAEFILHGLAEHSRIGRSGLVGATQFTDLFRSMFSEDDGDEADAADGSLDS